MPKYLYHGTFSSLVPSILESGLLAVPRDWRVWKDFGSDDRVYLTDTARRAMQWAQSGSRQLRYSGSYAGDPERAIDLSVLRIKLFALDLEKLEQCGTEYSYQGDIPPEAITVI